MQAIQISVISSGQNIRICLSTLPRTFSLTKYLPSVNHQDCIAKVRLISLLILDLRLGRKLSMTWYKLRFNSDLLS